MKNSFLLKPVFVPELKILSKTGPFCHDSGFLIPAIDCIHKTYYATKSWWKYYEQEVSGLYNQAVLL